MELATGHVDGTTKITHDTTPDVADGIVAFHTHASSRVFVIHRFATIDNNRPRNTCSGEMDMPRAALLRLECSNEAQPGHHAQQAPVELLQMPLAKGQIGLISPIGKRQHGIHPHRLAKAPDAGFSASGSTFDAALTQFIGVLLAIPLHDRLMIGDLITSPLKLLPIQTPGASDLNMAIAELMRPNVQMITRLTEIRYAVDNSDHVQPSYGWTSRTRMHLPCMPGSTFQDPKTSDAPKCSRDKFRPRCARPAWRASPHSLAARHGPL